MRYGFLPVCLACLCLNVAQAAEEISPRVTLQYISPEKFTDISRTHYGPPDSGYLDQLQQHFVKKAATYLAPGQQLKVDVSDIDMAGGFEPWVMPATPDLRIVRDIYPPRITLHYELRDAQGMVLEQGEARLSNLAYLFNVRPDTTDTMRHEKALLDDWLRKLFSGTAE